MAKKADVNSTTNQEIKGRFVAREVKACFSYEMDAILKVNGSCDITKDLPSYDDIENMYEYKCPECGEGYPDLDSIENPHGEDSEEDKKYFCRWCKAYFDEEPENEPQEIFEWWIVTEWLYEKLKAKGQPVLEWGNNYYWGRCTTGQAILLDGVISEICSEMQILEGQANDWSK